MEITSLDCAKLLQNIAWVYYKRILNKTQVNKILFIAYGVYLARYNEKLFTDDTPKAWPFGPVFPKANKSINYVATYLFTEEKKKAFLSNKNITDCLKYAVNQAYNKTALDLTRWSHMEGSPWYNTIYKEENGEIKQSKWNTEIPDEEIKRYFQQFSDIVL